MYCTHCTYAEENTFCRIPLLYTEHIYILKNTEAVHRREHKLENLFERKYALEIPSNKGKLETTRRQRNRADNQWLHVEDEQMHAKDLNYFKSKTLDQ
jgi:hypothetical protein